MLQMMFPPTVPLPTPVAKAIIANMRSSVVQLEDRMKIGLFSSQRVLMHVSNVWIHTSPGKKPKVY